MHHYRQRNDLKARKPKGPAEFCTDCIGGLDGEITFCPLHASAPQLKALNKQLGEALTWALPYVRDYQMSAKGQQIIEDAELALAAAKEMGE
ncbi:hypothetical protein LCGC14_1382000 [marine sediment metagenome]|uniref:Uncharacterized protein n=1 Tax=marine sediment metagenome TaxID=412755 RepID=A0A0F9KN84_9ZZZZ